ncbi:MAG: site-specific DNA-methyltransferase [Chloroflexi bacterium]|nr:site-specific DNA-methyltransferase [Chloroflexota bacterium]
MPRRKQPATPPTDNAAVTDYRHGETRKNIPPAGLAARGRVQEVPKTRYAYDPHLPPVLRFDPTGGPDHLPDLLAAARTRPLTDAEARLLADALRSQQPWLEWAGKREKHWLEVDPVALHIHERVSAQAIIKLALREPLQRSLFADPELEYRKEIQFYQHNVSWSNRLILGDSLVVMDSLAKREDLAGKVQMIYLDPPYGIKFASNFQAQVGVRDVKDKDADLTREPEQIKAYRDTWTLGIHSYLAYLRDRLIAARQLLTDSGSIFVQISDENIHRVRLLMDEVFGTQNYCLIITYQKTGGIPGTLINPTMDYVLWYAKQKEVAKFRPLYVERLIGDTALDRYDQIEFTDFSEQRLTSAQIAGTVSITNGSRFQLTSLFSEGASASGEPRFLFRDVTYQPSSGKHWTTNLNGLSNLAKADRIQVMGSVLRYKRYLKDFAYVPITDRWDSVQLGTGRIYVVQTSTTVIERCLLMTTDPGDLVLDPTCGSGTTATVAEQWGRRWITIDTSRVALALARQRLLTAKYDYYQLADPAKGVSGGFICKTVPHITLKSIAQNQALDPIFAKWEPRLAAHLAALNAALAAVPADARARLAAKLVAKEKREGKSSISEADRRRWLLPIAGWREWQVPFDSDPDWPASLQDALRNTRAAWRAKMDEVNAIITASAPQETLVDQPKVAPGILRVSGPFTVEGVQPVEESLDSESPIGGQPDSLPTFEAADPAAEPANAEAYLDKMVRLLRQDGVRFPDNKAQKFLRLEPLAHSILHAEGEWGNGDGPRRVAVSFGPQYGPITAKQVEECIRSASRRGCDDLVFAGFTIDAAAQAAIQDDPDPQVRCHLAHIRPDVNMGDLLKDTPGSQLFTVFGLPRVSLKADKDQWMVEMEGVDIYDPLTNSLRATRADKVAAWFLDSDYDGRTFCVTQAFFPDSGAWEKLARALKASPRSSPTRSGTGASVDEERFAAFSGTRSLPFPAGPYQRIAVKVIDPRGNEVMRVMRLSGPSTGSGYTTIADQP